MKQIIDIVNIPLIKVRKRLVGYISTNLYYSGIHWSVRNKIKDAWHNTVIESIKESNIKQCPYPISITFYWNTRYDLDNNGIMRKMIIDSLVLSGIIIDDTKKYIKRITEELTEEKLIRVIIQKFKEL